MNVLTVQESFSRCTLKGGFIDRFYELFLGSHPAFKPMFKDTDFAEQKQLLRKGISMMILFAQGSPMASNTMDRLAKTHGSGGMAIQPQYYTYWLDALMRAVAEFDPKFSPALEKDWRQALAVGIERLTRPEA